MRYATLPVLVTVMRRALDVNNVRGAFAAALETDDWGLVSEAVTSTVDYDLVTVAVNDSADWGLVSATPLMASLRQTTGRQQVEAGFPDDMIDVLIRFPVSAFTLTITADDRLVVTLSGVSANYAIKSAGLPERRGGYIEVACVRSIGN